VDLPPSTLDTWNRLRLLCGPNAPFEGLGVPVDETGVLLEPASGCRALEVLGSTLNREIRVEEFSRVNPTSPETLDSEDSLGWVVS
jgi:hypothetical protein